MGCMWLGQMYAGVVSLFTSELLREIKCELRQLACLLKTGEKHLLAGGHVST